jgi:nitrogen fixation-related uncharacterized protein
MELIVLLISIIAVGLGALAWGVDSRESLAEGHRP